MTIQTRCTCPFCGRVSTVETPAAGLAKWEAGALIQRAFPEMSTDNRELLMTGICSKCFPSDPEEEDE